MGERRSLVGHFLALGTILVWGMTFIATKVLLRTFTPVEILVLRFGIAVVVLLLLPPRPIRPVSVRQECYFAAAGLCGVTLYYLLENLALDYTLVANVSVIVSTAPFFTALLAQLFLGEKHLSPRFLIGFVCALTGIGIMMWSGSSALHLRPTGDLLALLAAIAWAVYSLLIRKIGTFGYPTIALTRRVFVYSFLSMLPIARLMGFHVQMAQMTEGHTAACLLFLAVGASAICFVTWNMAIRMLGAVRSSVYIYLTPAVSLGGAVMLLHEPVRSGAIAGMLLAFVGLLLSREKGADRR